MRLRLMFLICRIRGHNDQHRYGFTPGNLVCRRCGRVVRSDGTHSPILWPGES